MQMEMEHISVLSPKGYWQQSNMPIKGMAVCFIPYQFCPLMGQREMGGAFLVQKKSVYGPVERNIGT